MALRIETFDNIRGGNTLYKALTHPHAAASARALITSLEAAGPLAIVDPHGAAAGFAEIFGSGRAAIDAVYVQDIARIGAEVLGHHARPVTELTASRARSESETSGSATRPTSAWMAIFDTWWATTSWSSRAIRARSSIAARSPRESAASRRLWSRSSIA